MKISYIWMALILATMGLSSCKKSSDAPSPIAGGTANTNLLKTWKVSEVLEGTIDITSEFSQYSLTFAEADGNKTYTLVKRDGTTVTGIWSISDDETSIDLTENGTTTRLSGLSISASTLKYSADETGKTGTIKLAFTLIPA